MNTYVCPICGKTYTSATAMAQCVAECAKKEDKTKALKEAESTMLLAREAFEQAIEEYNSLSTEYEYTFTLGKKAKNGRGISAYKGRRADFGVLDEFSGKSNATALYGGTGSDLESALKAALKIDEPKPKVNVLDAKFEEKLKAFEDVGMKMASTPKEKAECKIKIAELRNEYEKATTDDEKKELICAMEAGLGIVNGLMKLLEELD